MYFLFIITTESAAFGESINTIPNYAVNIICFPISNPIIGTTLVLIKEWL